MRKVYTSKFQNPSLKCTNAKGGGKVTKVTGRSQVPTKPCHNLASSSLVPQFEAQQGHHVEVRDSIAIPLFRQTCYDVQYMIKAIILCHFHSFPYLFFLSNIPFKIFSQLAFFFSAKHGSVGFVFIALPPRKGVQKGAQQEPKVFMGGRDGGFTLVLLGFTKDNVI